MSEVMRALTEDEPLMKAWKEYLATPNYTNSYEWAKFFSIQPRSDGSLVVTHPNIQGSLWAAFMAGWKAAGGELK